MPEGKKDTRIAEILSGVKKQITKLKIENKELKKKLKDQVHKTREVEAVVGDAYSIMVEYYKDN